MLKFSKATVLALYAMMDLARADGEPVTTAQIADRHGVSPNHLAKVLRQLMRRGLVATTRGAGGGHRLARPAKDVTLGDVVELFEGPREAAAGALALGGGSRAEDEEGARRLRAIFEEMDEHLHFTLRSISLSTLVKRFP